MKKIIKNYILLYNRVKREKGVNSLVTRFDRVKHGFVGDIIFVIVLLFFMWRNDFGNEIIWTGLFKWLVYLFPAFFARFVAGYLKELWDERKKNNYFDWGDVWATTLPFLGVYFVMKQLILLFFGKIVKKIEEG